MFVGELVRNPENKFSLPGNLFSGFLIILQLSSNTLHICLFDFQTVDEEQAYTDEEFQRYEQMMAEHEQRMRQQGLDPNMVQPGMVVCHTLIVETVLSCL